MHTLPVDTNLSWWREQIGNPDDGLSSAVWSWFVTCPPGSQSFVFSSNHSHQPHRCIGLTWKGSSWDGKNCMQNFYLPIPPIQICATPLIVWQSFTFPSVAVWLLCINLDRFTSGPFEHRDLDCVCILLSLWICPCMWTNISEIKTTYGVLSIPICLCYSGGSTVQNLRPSEQWSSKVLVFLRRIGILYFEVSEWDCIK